MELLAGASKFPVQAASKSWSLDFCLEPRRFIGSQGQSIQVASTEFTKTKLESMDAPGARATPTDDTVTIASQTVFRSIGYKSVALPGLSQAGIAFDGSRGVVENDGLGRVLQLDDRRNGEQTQGKPFPGLYCSGWVKRGPTGVIASTLEDAFITGETIVQDWLNGEPFLDGQRYSPKAGWEGVKVEFGGQASGVVTWADWQKIDRAERERGREAGKEREKFTSTAEMLNVLG